MKVYRTFVRTPGTKRVILAGWVGRLPDGMINLAFVLLVSRHAGFATAGATAGAYAVTYGLSSPLRGRLVDRLGPRRVLWSLGAGQAVALAALGLAVTATLPALVYIGAAGAVGLLAPPMSAILWLVWTENLVDVDVRRAAYALESVSGELVFIVGTIVVGTIAAVGPELAPLGIAVACRFVGAAALATSSLTRISPSRQGNAPKPPGPVRSRRVVVLLATVALCFCALGALDLGVIAYARAHHIEDVTGLLLALIGIGSVVGGLAQGARAWKTPLSAQHIGWLGVLVLALAAVAVSPSPVIFAALLVVAGLPLAPLMTIQMSLGTDMARDYAIGEMVGWIFAMSYLGMAVGTYAAGVAIDTVAPEASLYLAVASSVAALGVAATHTPRSRRGRDSSLRRHMRGRRYLPRTNRKL